MSILLGIYVVGFWVAETKLQAIAVALMVVPVIGASWYLGIWGGLLSTTLAILVSILLLEIKGYQNAWQILIYDGLVGTLMLYLISAVVGYMGLVKRHYQDAVSRFTQKAKKYEARAGSLSNIVNITNQALDAENLNAVLSVLAEESRKMFNADDCLISLWDSNLDGYYPRAAAGDEVQALKKMPTMQDNAELVRFQNADILVYGNIEELSVTWRIFGLVHPQGSLLALPLTSGGQKIGILQLLYEYKHEFPPNDLLYAKLASRQISQVVWKLILLTHANDQVEELQVLHRVAVVLAAETEEAALLDKTLYELGSLLYHQNLTIVLINENRKVLVRTASYQLDSSDIVELIPLGQGVTGRVAQTGVLERYDDVRKAPSYVNALANTRSEICVPIKSRGKILGVINIESDQYAAFDERDERILTTVANQIGGALIRLRTEQAKIERVNEIARSKDLIQGLTEVASTMEMSSDPTAVMKEMGAALDRKGWKVLIALMEPDSQELVVRYTSLDPVVIRKLERFSKSSMKDFRLAAADLPEALKFTENLHPRLFDDYVSVIAQILRGYTTDLLHRVLDRTLDTEKTILGHFPLVYHEKILGFLWLWGADLREDDLPTLSVFASQVASTLENARLFADVQRLAVTDGLTQIYTRRHFFELAFEEFYRARRYGRPLSIIMFDLDHFKCVNDTYGHSAGDVVLQETAAICRDSLRTNDIVGRYGGEEIVILLVETSTQAAEHVANRIWKRVRELVVPTSKGDVQVTISGGVAGDNVENMNLIEMIEAADQALYRAKENGRDRVEVFTQTTPDE